MRIRLGLGLLLALLGALVAWGEQPFPIVERLALPAGAPTEDVRLRAVPLAGGDAIEAPATMIAQAADAWICGELKLPASGAYRLLAVFGQGEAATVVELDARREVTWQAYDVALVIDISRSMLENDPRDLRAAALRRFIALSRGSRAIRHLGIVVFHRYSFTKLPLTVPADVPADDTLVAWLRPTGFTNFDAPLKDARDLLAPSSQPHRVVLFLSDGQPVDKYRESHRELAALGIPVYTIGLSDEADMALLGRIAEETGGQAFAAPTADELDPLFVRLFHLLDQPVSIARHDLASPDAASAELLLDPTLRNPMLRFAPVAGEPAATLEGDTIYTPALGDLALTPLADPRLGPRALRLVGDGRLAVDLMATTDLRLYPLPLGADGPGGLPLLAAGWLSGAGDCRELSATAFVSPPDGPLRPVPVTVDAATGLFTVRDEATRAGGSYGVLLTVEGLIDGQRFRRNVRFHFTRQATNAPLPAAATGFDSTFKLVAPAPVMPRLDAQLPTPAPRLTAPNGAGLRTTWWASAERLAVDGLWPGTTQRVPLAVQVNSPENGELRLALVASPPPGVTLACEGELTVGRPSELTLIATAAADSAGQAFAGELAFSFGEHRWRVPFAGEVGVPTLRVDSSAVTIVEELARIIATSELVIAIEPAGLVEASIASDLPLLQLSPTQMTVGPDGATVNVQATLPVPLTQRDWRGRITVTAPGLEPVSLPYELHLAERPPTPEEAVAAEASSPATQAAFDWRPLLLALLIALLLLLLIAIFRGHRRAIYLLTSILLHVGVLFLILPKPEEPLAEANEVTTLTVTSGEVVHEQTIASEVAETQVKPTPEEAAETSPEAAALAAETAEESQPLAAERIVEQPPPSEAPTAEPAPLERESVELAAVEAPLPEVERKEVVERPEPIPQPREATRVAPAPTPLPQAHQPTPRSALQVTELREVRETAAEREVELAVDRPELAATELPTDVAEPERRRAESEAATPAEATQADSVQPASPSLPETATAPASEDAASAAAVTGDAPAAPTATASLPEIARAAATPAERRSEVEAPARRPVEAAGSEAAPAQAAAAGTAAPVATMAGSTAAPVPAASTIEAASAVQAAAPAVAPGALAVRLDTAARPTVAPSDLPTTVSAPQRQPTETEGGEDAAGGGEPRAGDGALAAARLPAGEVGPGTALAGVPSVTAAVAVSAGAPSAAMPEIGRQAPALAEPTSLPAMPMARAAVTTPGSAAPGEARPAAGQPTAMTGLLATIGPASAAPAGSATAPRMSAAPAPASAASLAPPRPATRPSAMPGDLPGTASAPTPARRDATARTASDGVGDAPRPAGTAPLASTAPGDGEAEVAPANGEARRMAALAAAIGVGTTGVVRENGHGVARPATAPADLHASVASTPSRRPVAGAAPIALTGQPVAAGFAPQATARHPEGVAAMPVVATLAAPMAARPEIVMPGNAAQRPPAVSLVRGADGEGRGLPSTLPLVQYGGDWDCDPTAMTNLAHQLERRTGSVLPIGSRTVPLTSPELDRLPFLFLTGHRDFAFTAPEVERLSTYLRGGGAIWINDSTDIGDDHFDAAVRRELARVLPGTTFQRIPADSNLFKAPYDLTKGFMGYAIPPGDKYRQDFLEGLWIDGRLAVIYTRNDYGDGLEIDPLTHPLMTSLSGLSPEQMQEGSVRMGTNIALFFTHGGQLPEARLTRRLQADMATREQDAGLPANLRPVAFPVFDPAVAWLVPEGWPDTLPAQVLRTPEQRLRVAFSKGGAITRRDKVIIAAPADLVLGRQQTIAFDVNSLLSGGARLAIAFSGNADFPYFESAPVYLRPGLNRDLHLDLAAKTFKSAATEWRYEAELPPNLPLTGVYFILYPQQSNGTIELSNLRLMR